MFWEVMVPIVTLLHLLMRTQIQLVKVGQLYLTDRQAVRNSLQVLQSTSLLRVDAKPQYRFACPLKSCIASLHFDIVQRSGSLSPFSDSPRVPCKLTRVKWADVDVASFASVFRLVLLLAECNPKVHARCDRYLISFRMLSGKEIFYFYQKILKKNKKKQSFHFPDLFL